MYQMRSTNAEPSFETEVPKLYGCEMLQSFVNNCKHSNKPLDLNSIFRSNKLFSIFCLRRDETIRWKFNHTDDRCKAVATYAIIFSSYPANGVAQAFINKNAANAESRVLDSAFEELSLVIITDKWTGVGAAPGPWSWMCRRRDDSRLYWT